jgi:hypothetical protein
MCYGEPRRYYILFCCVLADTIIAVQHGVAYNLAIAVVIRPSKGPFAALHKISFRQIIPSQSKTPIENN